MLTELQIKNVAIIDNITIEFGKGFNVLTGETGAGKSILIDSINMALGGRTSKDLVRTGTDYAFAQVVFEIEDTVREKLEELEIDVEDDNIILSRKITSEGKSNSKINGRTMPLSIVRGVGEILLNIHGQHDNQALFNPSEHISFLDNFSKNNDILKSYKEIYKKYSSLNSEYNALAASELDKKRELDLLKFSANEIQSLSLKPKEDEELEKRRDFLSNIENIIKNAGEAYNTLYGNEMNKSAFDMLSDASVFLENAAEFDEKIGQFYDTISSVVADVDDVTRELKSYLDDIDYNVNELDTVEERLSTISNLKRKYACSSIEELLSYAENCKIKIETLENIDERISELKKQIDIAEVELKRKAQALTNNREEFGRKLSDAIMNELSELDMSKVLFSVNINQTDYTQNGCDDVEFLISTNPGENLKPLNKIASGGEMSRIMLAIKSIISENDIVETMIFDEIDTGVSGRAAQKIAEKICKISRNKQILCITHLAQIACMADRQYLIQKTTAEDRTRTSVTLLSNEERCEELARIIGGVSVTETTLKAAEEMIQQAEGLKNNIGN